MVFVLVDWSCLVAKTDDRRQETSQLVGTTCRTRDLAAGLSDTAVFLISTLHVMGFNGRYFRARPASSEGSQKPAYRMGRSVEES